MSDLHCESTPVGLMPSGKESVSAFLPRDRMRLWRRKSGAGHISNSPIPCLTVALCAVCMSVAASYGAYACSTDGVGAEPRTILALFDGSQEADVRDTRIHRFLELPLNHLGYRVEYFDISRKLPPAVLATDVAAVVSWFDVPLSNPADYLKWASHVETACPGDLRQIVVGDIGVPSWLDTAGDRAIYLDRIGLALAANETIFGYRSAVRKSDPAMIGFETGFSIEPGRYPSYRSSAAGISYLQIAPRKDAADGVVDLATTGPRGGYLHDSAAMSFDGRSGKTFWVVDPFRFLETVLGPKFWPVADVTTMDGRRIFFSTVSSEGWLSAMPARGFDEEHRLASEILRDRILRAYSDLPTTVAVLAGDLEPSIGGRSALLGAEIAKEIFELPQVQIATTGFSLIRNWDYFANYDRASETRKLDELETDANLGARSGGLINVAVQGLANALVNTQPGRPDAIQNAPRKYANDPFDLYTELSRSLRAAASLGPTGSRAAAFLWTGDARPFEAALAAVDAAGAAAIGGGGGVYNASSPSLSGLSAFSVTVGSEIQVYNALSGDDAYTNFWSKPSYGFQAMTDTLKWTETPRRLKPFQLGYAAQSMIDFGSRRAVEILLNRARASDVIPVTASDYVAIVNGFRTFQAVRVGPQAWKIRNRGALSTVRFDRAAKVSVDLDASTGVLGARRKGDVLYVALVPGSVEPVVALATGAAPSGMILGAAGLGLSESRLQILDLRRGRCTARLKAAGYAEGGMVWFGPPDTSFAVRMTGATADPDTAPPQTLRSGADGRLDVAVPKPDGDGISISISGMC